MTRQVANRFSDLSLILQLRQRRKGLSQLYRYIKIMPTVLRNEGGRLRMDGDADVTGRGNWAEPSVD